jgi:hypothetical protein
MAKRRDYGFKIFAEQHPRYWPRLLAEWGSLVDRYCRVVMEPDDLPYFHKERANVGIVAAAAWRTGLVALQDLPVVRRRQARRGPVQLDLWIGSKNDGDAYEAKYVEVGRENVRHYAESCLHRAVDDVATLTERWYGKWRVGMVFCPIWLEGRGKGAAQARAADVLRSLEDVGASALAWALPRSRASAGWQTGVVWLLKIERPPRNPRAKVGRKARR